jgi:hypothetical protein
MKNTLTDLNNYLFETLERLMDDELSDKEMGKEITRSQAVSAVATNVVKNGELALKTMQHLHKHGFDSADESLPPMLEAKV